MRLHKVIELGQPFKHPSFIGCFWYVEGEGVYHRDNPRDFLESDWIRSNCTPERVCDLDWRSIIDDNWEPVYF